MAAQPVPETPVESLHTDQGIMTGRHSIQTPEVTQHMPSLDAGGSRASHVEAEAMYQATPDALLQGCSDLTGNNDKAQVSLLFGVGVVKSHMISIMFLLQRYVPLIAAFNGRACIFLK